MQLLPNMEGMMSSAPVKKFRLGFVEAAIWKNETNGNTFYNVKLSRTYKDGDELKNTDNLSHGDLLNAAKVLTRAEAWIADQ